MSSSNIIHSRLTDIVIPNNLPLHTYVFQNSIPSSPCLISSAAEGTRIYSYLETQLLCRKTATFLSSIHCIRKGHVILLLLPDCPEFVFSFLAASFLGAVAAPANPDLSHSEVRNRIHSIGANFVITQSCYIGKIPTDICAVLVVDQVHDKIDRASPVPDVSGVIGPDDAVAVMHSRAGKGCVLTHKSLVSNMAQQVDGENPHLHLRCGGDDVVLSALPLHLVLGLNCLLIGMRAGSTTVVTDKSLCLDAVIQRCKVTVVPIVPWVLGPMLEGCKYDLRTVRLVLVADALIEKNLEKAVRERMPRAILGQAYGMTEAGPVISMCPGFARQPMPSKSGSCGIVVRNAELKVIDRTTGFSLGRKQVGKICIRGPQIMKGYQIKGTKATSSIIDGEGWLNTGDVGYVDDDDEVFLRDQVQ